MLYYYWTVRYVPDTVRPTTVGVGVVVSSQSTLDVACKFITSPSDIVDIGGPQENMIESLKDIEQGINDIGVSSKNIYTYMDRLIRNSDEEPDADLGLSNCKMPLELRISLSI